jgi:hypothetical protein
MYEERGAGLQGRVRLKTLRGKVERGFVRVREERRTCVRKRAEDCVW